MEPWTAAKAEAIRQRKTKEGVILVVFRFRHQVDLGREMVLRDETRNVLKPEVGWGN